MLSSFVTALVVLAVYHDTVLSGNLIRQATIIDGDTLEIHGTAA
jgi:hypothetical protein